MVFLSKLRGMSGSRRSATLRPLNILTKTPGNLGQIWVIYEGNDLCKQLPTKILKIDGGILGKFLFDPFLAAGLKWIQ